MLQAVVELRGGILPLIEGSGPVLGTVDITGGQRVEAMHADHQLKIGISDAETAKFLVLP